LAERSNKKKQSEFTWAFYFLRRRKAAQSPDPREKGKERGKERRESGRGGKRKDNNLKPTLAVDGEPCAGKGGNISPSSLERGGKRGKGKTFATGTFSYLQGPAFPREGKKSPEEKDTSPYGSTRSTTSVHRKKERSRQAEKRERGPDFTVE